MDEKYLTELKEKILDCNVEEPYAFVSYSHVDRAYVWEDVVKLQELGYNIWIDKNVSLTEKKGWNGATQERIASIRCQLVLFYTSKDSLTSPACAVEVCACASDDAVAAHDGDVFLLRIDAVPIDNMQAFLSDAYRQVRENKALDSETATKRAKAKRDIEQACFPHGNSEVRLLNRKDPKQEENYYGKLEETLKSHAVRQYTPYERGAQLLCKKEYAKAIKALEGCDEMSDVPADLLHAYLLQKGLGVRQEPQKAEELLMLAGFIMSAEKWSEEAERARRRKDYLQALAYYLGSGMVLKDGESYIKAFLCCLKQPADAVNYELAESCLMDAQANGALEVERYLEGLRSRKENMGRGAGK